MRYKSPVNCYYRVNGLIIYIDVKVNFLRSSAFV